MKYVQGIQTFELNRKDVTKILESKINEKTIFERNIDELKILGWESTKSVNTAINNGSAILYLIDAVERTIKAKLFDWISWNEKILKNIIRSVFFRNFEKLFLSKKIENNLLSIVENFKTIDVFPREIFEKMIFEIEIGNDTKMTTKSVFSNFKYVLRDLMMNINFIEIKKFLDISTNLEIKDENLNEWNSKILHKTNAIRNLTMHGEHTFKYWNKEYNCSLTDLLKSIEKNFVHATDVQLFLTNDDLDNIEYSVSLAIPNYKISKKTINLVKDLYKLSIGKEIKYN